jgi:hypothetical protein
MAGKALDNRFDIIVAIISFILVFADILSPVGMLIVAAVAMNIYGRKWGRA